MDFSVYCTIPLALAAIGTDRIYLMSYCKLLKGY